MTVNNPSLGQRRQSSLRIIMRELKSSGPVNSLTCRIRVKRALYQCVVAVVVNMLS